MRLKIVGLASLAISLTLMVAALALLFQTYNRTQVPIQQAGASLQVQGIVLEKLVEKRPDRLLPFNVTTYIVRYAFPSASGQMRTGEQVVTRKVYESITRQGEPIWVMLSANDPTLNAIDTRLVFPGAYGWRVGLALAALILATAISFGSFLLANRFRASR